MVMPGNLRRWGKEASRLVEYGYDVIVPDYPGYGKSPGPPSESALNSTGDAVMKWALTHYEPDSITIYGRSLGSAVASYVSSKHPARQLILETTFYDFESLLQNKYKFLTTLRSDDTNVFPVYSYLEATDAPITIFQGDRDWVTPLPEAMRLKKHLKKGDKFFSINGGGHKNLNSIPTFKTLQEKTLND